MKYPLIALFLSVSIFPETAPAFQLSDTLLIEGYYSQQGRSIGRGKLENFLLNQNPSAQLADQAKGLRLSAWAIGTPLWCVNTGIAAYQIKQIFDAIEKQEMISPSINNFAVPLIIGSDITLFVQNILRNRSDYALHRAVIAYNTKIAEKYFPDSVMDHRIKKNKNSSWYMQDRVFMPDGVLMSVLKEKEASRATAYWSSATDLLANQAISIGGMFLALTLMDYMVENRISSGARVKLNVGIGVTSFGIINAIIADGLKKSAIRKYNDSIKPKS
jgi:hypothetical protein